MTKEQKVIRAKVGLLELAKQLGNVSQACKMMGYSRDSFYRFRELYENGGEVALQELTRKKPILANRTAPEVEALIVELSLDANCPIKFQLLQRSCAGTPSRPRPSPPSTGGWTRASPPLPPAAEP